MKKFINNKVRFNALFIYIINKIFLAAQGIIAVLLTFWYFILAYDSVRFGSDAGSTLPKFVYMDWLAMRNAALWLFVPAMLIMGPITHYVKIKRGRPFWGILSWLGWLGGFAAIYLSEYLGKFLISLLP